MLMINKNPMEKKNEQKGLSMLMLKDMAAT